MCTLSLQGHLELCKVSKRMDERPARNYFPKVRHAKVLPLEKFTPNLYGPTEPPFFRTSHLCNFRIFTSMCHEL